MKTRGNTLSLSLMIRPTVQPASLSWNKVPIRGLPPDFYYCQTIGVCWCGAPSLTRGRVCRSQLLLALASAITHWIETQWLSYGLGDRSSIPGRDRRYLYSPLYPYRLWHSIQAHIQWVGDIFHRVQSGYRTNMSTHLYLAKHVCLTL
jgi:hypothetical protein